MTNRYCGIDIDQNKHFFLAFLMLWFLHYRLLYRFQMFCSFIMAFQSLHPHVTEVYVIAINNTYTWSKTDHQEQE